MPPEPFGCEDRMHFFLPERRRIIGRMPWNYRNKNYFYQRTHGLRHCHIGKPTGINPYYYFILPE